MIACRNCKHRMPANNCGLAVDRGDGIKWCNAVTECADAPAAIDPLADHLKTLRRLTGWARSNYLSNVSRAEGQAAADRLNEADKAQRGVRA